MKLKRNLYLIVTAVVAGSLFMSGLAEFGESAGWRIGAFASFVPACYLVGAVGVICLGWCCHRLVKEITSTARLLTEKVDGRPLSIEDWKLKIKNHKGRTSEIERLHQAIEQRFVDQSDYTARLEKQTKDLQINSRLSQTQKSNAEAIIYSIRDAVIVVDESDRLSLANESAGRLFGFDFKTSHHQPVTELIGEDKAEFIDFLQQSRTSKTRASKREIGFSQAGQTKTFDCIVSCVYDQNNQVCGGVAVLHDITREKEISQMKNDFVGHVSHELKTPLASITAYSEMLLDDEAGSEQTRKEFYSIIQSQAQRLNRLIEDILNVSRIESGLIKVEKKPVSLTVLIEEQLQMMQSYAEEKNITLSRGDEGQKLIVCDQVFVDKDMISQVIVNLLSNAIKYTPASGSVKIETEIDEIANVVRVSVTDTGIGIAPESIEHVFDKFYRVKANKKQAKGTGLGLNLVKQIIEKVHDGRVFVKSQVGTGSTFGFELPLSRETIETAGR